MPMNPKLVAAACRVYKLMETMWGPIVHPKSPWVWLVNLIKNDCWYCTAARVAALSAGATALAFGHWWTALIALGGTAFIVAVERLAACATPVDADQKVS